MNTRKIQPPMTTRIETQSSEIERSMFYPLNHRAVNLVGLCKLRWTLEQFCIAASLDLFRRNQYILLALRFNWNFHLAMDSFQGIIVNAQNAFRDTIVYCKEYKEADKNSSTRWNRNGWNNCSAPGCDTDKIVKENKRMWCLVKK